MTRDRSGRAVRVGSRVRLLSIPQSLLADVPSHESRELRAMVGEIFEVQAIDDYGTVWIERWWQHGDGGSHGHSLALAPHEMELVVDSPS